MFGGGVVLLTLSAGYGEMARFEWASVSNVALAGWVYVSVLGSVAYGSYLWLMKASTPPKVATYAYVNPVIALFVGYVLADESLSTWTIGCSALIIVAVSLWCRSRQATTRAAAEARRVVRAPRSVPMRHLWIHAQRTCPHGLAVLDRGRDDLRRRHTLLDPALERRQGVELIRSRAAPAVPHSRNHEQPEELLRFG